MVNQLGVESVEWVKQLFKKVLKFFTLEYYEIEIPSRWVFYWVFSLDIEENFDNIIHCTITFKWGSQKKKGLSDIFNSCLRNKSKQVEMYELKY